MRLLAVFPFIYLLACSSTHSDPEASNGDASSVEDTTTQSETGDSSMVACSLADLHAKYLAGANDLDLDCDGKTDWHVTRDASGKPSSETLDIDGDGKPDVKIDRGATPQRLEIDTNLDGKIDLVVERKPGTAAGSFDYVEQRDLSLRTGTMTWRTTYTVDPALPSVEYVDEVLDADGVTWNEDRRTTAPRNARKVGSVRTSGTGACTPDQASKLENALDNLDKSLDCLAKHDRGLAWRTRWTLAASSLELSCVAGDGTYCGEATSPSSGCSFGFCSNMGVEITKDGLDNPMCGALSSTVFHEIMHYMHGAHHVDDGTVDANDPVWGCERLCGDPSKKPSANDCAACLQTSSGDARCADVSPRDCVQPEKGRCNCDKAKMKYYDTYTACTVGCPSGLACFGASCSRIPGPPQCEHEGVPCKCGCCDGLVCDPTDGKCTPE